MMKITALYTTPTDPAAFEAHYLSTHMPLVDTMPGLVRRESGMSVGTPDGSPAPFYRTADLYFEDMAAIGAAFGSPEGQATAKDAGELAARTGCQLTLMISQVD